MPGSGNADGYALSGTALSLRGAPYRDGGIDPSGFDCSGFVRYVYEQHGVAMPRQVRDQFRIGKNVDRDRLEPGDLVFFTTVAPGASHVGIVIGGDQFIHAPSERGVVRVESLDAAVLGLALHRRQARQLNEPVAPEPGDRFPGEGGPLVFDGGGGIGNGNGTGITGG